MKRYCKNAISLLLMLAMALVLVPAMSMKAYAADSDSYSYGLNVLGKEYQVKDGVITEYRRDSEGTVTSREEVDAMDLPDGITVDVPTCTITLNNYTGTISDSSLSSFVSIGLVSSVTPTIRLVGTNTLTVKDAGYDVACIDGGASGLGENLVICGNGTLNLNLSGNNTAFGIRGAHITEISDCTINITSTNPKGFVYGYSAVANRNYEWNADYAALEISNADINIDSTMKVSAANAGIDVQDSDLSITNSRISMNLTGGYVYGLCGGLLDDGTDYYGGKFNIDADSEIIINANSDDGVQETMYYYDCDFSANNIYAGDSRAKSSKITADDFETTYDVRHDCTEKYLEISPHVWNSTTTPATTSADGTTTRTCSHCDESLTATIPKIVTIKAGESLSRTWTGWDDGVFMIIKDSEGNYLTWKTKKNSDFKSVGKHTFTVSSDSEFYDFSKTLTLTITPRKAVISKLTSGKNCLTVKMKAAVKSSTGGSAYQIAYKQKGTSKWKYAITTSTSKTIKKLKKGKYYYIKVRAYKKVSGKTYYGAWSSTKLSKKIK